MSELTNAFRVSSVCSQEITFSQVLSRELWPVKHVLLFELDKIYGLGIYVFHVS